MANYLCFYLASDSHIDFIAENPETLWRYLDGKCPARILAKRLKLQQRQGTVPRDKLPPEIPDDWPEIPATRIGPSIRDGDVSLYHLILNGTTDFVTGSGSIFQTWWQPAADRPRMVIDLTGEKKYFALHSDQLPELVDLISRIEPRLVEFRLTEWLRAGLKVYKPLPVRTQEMWCAGLVENFSRLAEGLREAIQKSQGLIWILC